MRNYTFFTAAIAAMVFLGGCKKDDSPPEPVTPAPPSNEFIIDSDRTSLTSSMMLLYGYDEEGDAADVEMILFSDGLTADFEELEFSGTGFLLYMGFNSSDSTMLPPGNYPFDPEYGPFSHYEVWVSYIENGEETPTEFEIFNITIEVQKNGMEYSLSGSGSDVLNRPFSFQYTGTPFVIPLFGE